jgi:hypothetical protein
MATASSAAAGVFPIRRYTLFYYLGVCLLLIAYAVLAVVLSLNKDWVKATLPGALSASRRRTPRGRRTRACTESPCARRAA